jgi:hypothetical protein
MVNRPASPIPGEAESWAGVAKPLLIPHGSVIATVA